MLWTHDGEAFFDFDHASLSRDSVDMEDAFKASAHHAKGSPRCLRKRRMPKSCDAASEQCGGEVHAFGEVDGLPVKQDGYFW